MVAPAFQILVSPGAPFCVKKRSTKPIGHYRALTGGSGHAEPRKPLRRPLQSRPLLFGDGAVRLQNEHWLDYGHIALAVLVMGLGIVMLAALSI